MKKSKLIILMLLFLTIACGKYAEGKDTVESFGDGALQILKWFDPIEGKSYSLQNLENHKSIEMYIEKYKIKNNRLFLVGRNGYTVVEISSKKYLSSKHLSDFDILDQQILTEEGTYKEFNKK